MAYIIGVDIGLVIAFVHDQPIGRSGEGETKVGMGVFLGIGGHGGHTGKKHYQGHHQGDQFFHGGYPFSNIYLVSIPV